MYKLGTMYVQNKNILKQEKLHLNNHFNKLKKTAHVLLYNFILYLTWNFVYFIFNFF